MLDKIKKLSLLQSVRAQKGGETVYGYHVPAGYMGWVVDRWMLFATESDYYDYMS